MEKKGSFPSMLSFEHQHCKQGTYLTYKFYIRTWYQESNFQFLQLYLIRRILGVSADSPEFHGNMITQYNGDMPSATCKICCWAVSLSTDAQCQTSKRQVQLLISDIRHKPAHVFSASFPGAQMTCYHLDNLHRGTSPNSFVLRCVSWSLNDIKQ